MISLTEILAKETEFLAPEIYASCKRRSVWIDILLKDEWVAFVSQPFTSLRKWPRASPNNP